MWLILEVEIDLDLGKLATFGIKFSAKYAFKKVKTVKPIEVDLSGIFQIPFVNVKAFTFKARV